MTRYANMPSASAIRALRDRVRADIVGAIDELTSAAAEWWVSEMQTAVDAAEQKLWDRATARPTASDTPTICALCAKPSEETAVYVWGHVCADCDPGRDAAFALEAEMLRGR